MIGMPILNSSAQKRSAWFKFVSHRGLVAFSSLLLVLIALIFITVFCYDAEPAKSCNKLF